jgi:hypothetical protein
MALDFSELNGFAPGDDSVPFDPRMITGFTGARSGQRPSPTALPTFGQMIGARTAAVATPGPQARTAPDVPAPSFSSLMQAAASAMLGADGARQHLGRPDVEGARQYLSRAGWAGKLPPTPAHQEKIRQYLWRAGWDGKSEPTQELEDKAYQLSPDLIRSRSRKSAQGQADSTATQALAEPVVLSGRVCAGDCAGTSVS